MEDPKPFSTRYTDEELKQFAVDLFEGKIFTSARIPEAEAATILPSVFMPLFFMDEDLRKDFVESKPVLVFEYLSKAGPRSINGYPMFTSMQFLNEEEYNKMKITYDALLEAKKKVLEEE